MDVGYEVLEDHSLCYGQPELLSHPDAPVPSFGHPLD